MNAHDKRLDTFMNIFQPDKKFGDCIFVPEMVEPTVIDKVVKVYDGDVEKESIIGLIYPKRRNRWKKGLVFTDYKIYTNIKKAKKKKIWYDEIRSIRVKFFFGKKVIICLDDGNKVVLKTSRRFSRKLVEFVKQVKSFNDEVGEYKGTLKAFWTSDLNASMFSGFEVAKHEMVYHGYVEEKFHAQQGHGFAAEEANNMIDRLHGKNARVVGNDNAKNGPDRYIKYRDGSVEWVQSKYCKSAYDSINNCFNENGFRYYDGTGKPMSIEVPSDQYEQAVRVMEDKISKGLVKGVTDPQKAREIVKKGNITYKQAVNIAKAGNIDSIMYDATKGMVVSASAFGISAMVSLATSIWNGDEFSIAVKRAACTGVKMGGASFLTSVLASQLSKAGLNSALVGVTEKFTKMLGRKTYSTIINAFRGGAKDISGAAALSSAAKLLRTNIITSIVMIVIFSIGDFINLLLRRITFGQFIKNFIVLTLSIVASFVGGIIGAVIGTAILPGIGSFIGSILFAILAGALTAHLGRKLLGILIKDDADKMVKIIEEEIIKISEDYLLSKNETEKVVDKLARKVSLRVIRKMVASKDKSGYARNLVLPIVEVQVKKRKKIAALSEEVMIDALNQMLEENQTNPGWV